MRVPWDNLLSTIVTTHSLAATSSLKFSKQRRCSSVGRPSFKGPSLVQLCWHGFESQGRGIRWQEKIVVKNNPRLAKRRDKCKELEQNKFETQIALILAKERHYLQHKKSCRNCSKNSRPNNSEQKNCDWFTQMCWVLLQILSQKKSQTWRK